MQRMHESAASKPSRVYPKPVRIEPRRRDHEEVRNAVRFPLVLPVVVSTGDGEMTAITKNVSASGVLFMLEEELPVGADVKFTMRMPRAVLGTPHDVLVHCKGRVVRCSTSPTEYFAAATIDEYRFAEQ